MMHYGCNKILLVVVVTLIVIHDSSWSVLGAEDKQQKNRKLDKHDDELGDASYLFTGDLEVVAEHPEFAWLESPLYAPKGKYVLFSDVKWADENGNACGMIWKYSDKDGLSKFLKCSGLVGPGDSPSNLDDHIEAGGNGMFWGWDGEGDLLICQHGKNRIVRINVDDVIDEHIDPDNVEVVVDMYNGQKFNSPNDLMVDYNYGSGDIYFTDPPFGLQYKSADDPFANAFEPTVMNQETSGIYKVDRDTYEVTRIASIDPINIEGPNGIAATGTPDEIVVAITNWDNPRAYIYNTKSGKVLDTIPLEKRIEGENSYYPALADGITYSKDLGVFFLSGPGGIYIYESKINKKNKYLGFLRIDDLNANNDVGGEYLWITANTRLIRIPMIQTTNGGGKKGGGTKGKKKEKPPKGKKKSKQDKDKAGKKKMVGKK